MLSLDLIVYVDQKTNCVYLKRPLLPQGDPLNFEVRYVQPRSSNDHSFFVSLDMLIHHRIFLLVLIGRLDKVFFSMKPH
jgi:hypothetical protein